MSPGRFIAMLPLSETFQLVFILLANLLLEKMSSLRTQSTAGGVVGLSSVGSDRTGATSTAAGSHSHSHRKHHHHHRSRSAPRAPEKPPRKRHLNPGHSLASIPSQIKLSMLNSGLISFVSA
ncbi:unnamed protein product [Xylocopa violacea]|uniref:Uncharacterized protein n=1 Tax=Xylocopa violacea TaxID=135666 RepID=A0ABP1NEE6_XYLVO